MLFFVLMILCTLVPRVSLEGKEDKESSDMEIIKTEHWDPQLKERWNAFLEKRGREIAFDGSSSSLNVTSVSGKDVYLTCALNKPIRGKYKISLMRLRDLNLLAVDKSLHTKDPRMEILKGNVINTRVWTLKIRDAVPEDSGLYECHLNSIPKSKTLLLNVTIVEGHIRILPENSVLHLNVGSDLNLTCIVESGPVRPKYIHWYHKNRLLQFDENSPATITSHQRTSSSLFISSLSPRESGEYKCGSDLTGEVGVKVYVVQEDLKTLHLGTAVGGDMADKKPLPKNASNGAQETFFHKAFALIYAYLLVDFRSNP